MNNSPGSDINDQAPAVRAPDVGLTGNAVKIIAVVSMLIDHIGYALIWPWLSRIASTGNSDLYNKLRVLYYASRAIGRLAFPLFCFFIIEGLIYTRSRFKYALRLALFALISELPFDLAFYQNYRYHIHNNVFITMLIGLLMVWVMQEAKERLADRVVIRDIIWLAAVGAACALAVYLHCDYTYSGILCIASFWLLRDNRQWATTTAVGMLVILSSPLEIAALMDIPVLMNYNGRRGSKSFKYFFYLFYPAHLMLLALIGRGIGLTVWR